MASRSAIPHRLTPNRITGHLGIGSNGYTVRTARYGNTQTGFRNISVTLRCQAEFSNRPILLVEVAYSSPASQPSNPGTQFVFAPGVITQLHLFFDDLFPNSLGQPLLSY